MRRTGPLIVGGGPAGTAAAIVLAQGGAKPLLLERRRAIGSSVCGGFLSADTLASLVTLGIDTPALGAPAIERVRIVVGARSVTAPLPWRAAGLSRAGLDRALLARAATIGVGVEAGVAVRGIEEGIVRTADGAALAPSTLFVATGKHALRGCLRDTHGHGAVGLRASLPPSTDLAGVIELHPFRGGYAGLLLQEDGQANLCLSVAAARLRTAGSMPALLETLANEAPQLGARLAGARGWESIAGVPYGWRARQTQPGLFRLGDQAGVIASLVGDGIGIALASGRSAAQAALDGRTAPAWQHGFARSLAPRLLIAETARAIAERPAFARAALGGIAHLPGLVPLLARATRAGH